MKLKIIFLILLFGINILRVSAEEGWQLEKIEGENVEVEYRYKWYKEKVVGDYFLYSQSITTLPLVDKENYKFTDYSQWKDTCQEASDVIEVEEKEVYPYKRLLDVRYVKIKNLETTNLKINELMIKSIDGDVLYNILGCNMCTDYLNITDGEDYTFLELNSNEELVLEIPSYAKIENLSFLINSNSGNISVDLSFTQNEILASKELILNEGTNTYELDSSWVKIKKYTSLNYSVEKIENNFFNTVYEKENKCRERKKMYFFYRIEKEYYDDDYHKYVEDYIKDESDYIIMYRLKNVENEDTLENNENIEEEENTLENNENIKEEDIVINNDKNTTIEENKEEGNKENKEEENVNNKEEVIEEKENKEELLEEEILEEKDIPKTNDNIYIYIYLFSIALIFGVSLTFYILVKRKMSNEYYR